ncbi:HAMP domain-containing sensor histidine kinase (plasmid) [Shinella yambaruensis]|uniref:HAMP domain-containing sensor histidine kinase n=1 Tax=Shinella yambaruensis TaxID=415996 RepID=UPI003D792AE0
MRGRLFLKIYLTVLAGIAILAIAGIVMVALFVDREDRGWVNQRAELLAAMLSSPEEPQAVLNRIGPASHAEIELRDAAGTLVAAYRPAERDGITTFAPVTVAVRDGGTLTARFTLPFRPRGNPLLLLALVAGLTALAAWPVVRNLTRRLERLRHGVESWGKGNLSLRVAVEGRDEVASVADSFNRAAAQVEALVNSNRSLLANASHELRSPLARLRMAVHLHEDNPTQTQREEIARNLGELDDLVGEILLSSRLTHGERTEAFQPLDLLALAAEEAARAGLDASGTPTEVMGDARLLSRAIRNLIQNAVRHGAAPITISVGSTGAMTELSVRDHGAGIPAGEGERVFEPFYRPGGHGEAAGGWGLGLSLVRQIAQLHGGTVLHDPPRDGGTRFILRLPRLDTP